MGIRLFNDAQQWHDDDGDPLNAGKIYFYEPGTTTLKDTYTTKSLGTAHANPVILDANGRPTNPIWLNGEYKYKVTTSGDVDVGLTIDNLNSSTASTVETGLTPPNGSFQIDTSGDGQPDDWTITPLASATIAIDTTDSVQGKNSLKFTSGGNGGGTATTARFDVLKGGVVPISFTYKASAVDVLTKVDVKTYDKDDVIISTLSGYSEGASNPTTYTKQYISVTADATAVTAEVVITGIDASSTTKTTGTTTHVDAIKVDNIDLLDEDTLVSDSAAHGATQQSIKTLIDSITITYATGTWTPNLDAASGSGETYSIQQGNYTRIGNTVFVSLQLAMTGLGTLSGAITINDLPITADADTEPVPGQMFCSVASGVSITDGHSIGGYIVASGTSITMTLANGTTGTALMTAANLTASGNINMHGFYRV